MKPALIIACVLLAGTTTGWTESSSCKPPIEHGEPVGYRVVAYDAASNTWTIHRNGTFDGKYLVKRIVVACASHSYRDGQMTRGRDVCSLNVGRLYYGFRAGDCADGGDYEYVEESSSGPSGPMLFIAKGPDSMHADGQLFRILRYDVLPDSK